jgi:putative Mg2+ transporter-C (MgtC) family protein
LQLLVTNAPTLHDWQLTVRLLLAAGLGGALGIERELREHEAGFRTHVLVALGSAIFTLVGAYGFADFGRLNVDPTRIAAQIVTGIGFLGAGAIIRDGLSVRGLTTAANLWAVAAIGICCGAGYYLAALVGTAIALVALYPLRVAADMTIDRWRRAGSRVVLDVEPGGLSNVLEAISQQNRRIYRFEVEHEGERRHVTFELDRVDAQFVARLSEVGGVTDVGWER